MTNTNSAVSDLNIVSPTGLSAQMLFRVYSGLNLIGYAQLRRPTAKRRQRLASVESNAPSVSYCLANIAVSQNYQNLGVGSALLTEVLNFCYSQQVRSLYGEAKGDSELLAHWYRRHGFVVDDADNIALDLQEV